MPRPLPPGYAARRPHANDMAAVATLVNLTSVAQAGVPLVSADQIGAVWQAPGHDPSLDDWLVEASDGRRQRPRWSSRWSHTPRCRC